MVQIVSAHLNRKEIVVLKMCAPLNGCIAFQQCSFVAFWLASTLLLRRSRAKRETVKFYSIVTLPLLLFWSLPIAFLTASHILNAVQSYTFDVIKSILTRPLSGILFVIAF